jgi:radical SAM superfamily enzyme YgiQ (UPF0313 family)
MKLAILDSNYMDQKYQGLAASWLRWELGRLKTDIVDPAAADILLVTVSSPQGYPAVRRLLKRIGNRGAKIVLGGGGAFAPAVFDDIADVACVGEGPRFVRTLVTRGLDEASHLPNAWLPGDTRSVVPDEDFPWDCPPIRHPDGTVRVAASRGCRFRCMFCQTGWESRYRAANPARVQDTVKSLISRGHRVAVLTNDGADMSVQALSGGEFLSVRFDTLRKLMPINRSNVKSVRIGVEGISARLRSAVGKPIDAEELVDVSRRLILNGIGVRWFFIVGLPGETDEDWLELRELVVRVSREIPRGCVMSNFHAFIPQPATPLCVPPLVDEYWDRFDEFRRWFFHGGGRTRRMQLVSPCKYPGRLERARQSMGATETELRAGLWTSLNANWRISYPHGGPSDLRQIARRYFNRLKTVTREGRR